MEKSKTWALELRPGRLTKLHKDVFGRVQSNGLKVLPHQDFDWSFVPVLRDLLTPVVRLQHHNHRRKEEKYFN